MGEWTRGAEVFSLLYVSLLGYAAPDGVFTREEPAREKEREREREGEGEGEREREGEGEGERERKREKKGSDVRFCATAPSADGICIFLSLKNCLTGKPM